MCGPRRNSPPAILPRRVLIPWTDKDFATRAAKELDPGKPVLVYCRSGRRSAEAAAALAKLGFTDVRNLEGGILAWEKAEQPDHQARVISRPMKFPFFEIRRFPPDRRHLRPRRWPSRPRPRPDQRHEKGRNPKNRRNPPPRKNPRTPASASNNGCRKRATPWPASMLPVPPPAFPRESPPRNSTNAAAIWSR